MDPVIFLEKVRRPDLRGLVRSRLGHGVADGPTTASLGLVLAPPGSGKTTFLSHLAAASTERVAWYRMGAEDDDEVALTRHLGHTLGAALGLPGVIESAAAGRVAGLLAALEDPAVRPVQLILDDLQEIANSEAERALERFLALRPRKVRVLLGSRRPPQVNIPRLLVSGELQQLDGNDLRFRSWEVEELFQTVYEKPLSPEAAAALTRRTGGWAAGLQLFHLATSTLSRADRERSVEQLGGRSRLIRSYLARNVLAGLSARRRDFLLRTCTLGVLTGDLADALLGTSGSAAELADLEAEQFFTTSADGGLTFRFHQVLQTHLEVVLVDELGGEAARALYSRSGELLEQAGRPAAAVRAHARAEDWGAVARLLQPDALPVRGDEALWGMLALPGAPTDDPGLVLAGARRLLRNGLVTESVAAFRQAELLLDDREFSRRCAAERAAAAVWLPQPTGEPLPGAGRGLRLSAELRQITREVRDPGAAEHDLTRGLATMLAGDLPGAVAILRSAEPGAGAAAWEPLALRLAGHLVEMLIAPDLTGAGSFEEIVLSADVDGWPWLSRIAHGLQAAMLLGLDPAPWRVSACTDLLADLDRGGDPWAVCLTSLAVGYAYAAIYRDHQAEAPLRRAEEVAAELGASVLQAWATALRNALAQRRGSAGAHEEAAAIRPWAEGLGLGGLPDLLRRRRGASYVDPTRRQLEPAAPRTAAPASVELRGLGGFSLRVGGTEAGWSVLRPRVRALLLRLALQHGRPIHREQLVDELWPDASLASGIRSLQVAVSAVRQCLVAAGLGEDCLPRHGDAYALELTGVDDQVATFERLARQAAREQAAGRGVQALSTGLAAVDRYTGDLLPEVGPAEWVVAERDRLRLLAATTAAAAAQEALELGELAAGVGAAQRSVALDPYHDSSWTLLVELCQRSGDDSAAAVARRAHARVRADLGVVLPRSAVLPGAGARPAALMPSHRS
ncbi:BTAD domain-containing putative transcriptional regulator [uncultured Friedmanniella sp.]|uniref:BTAD domain-containing putative transcriptional regulator n=1 Tax=uncultured Friedmanniella sp. TaxID=335381 RepID=UPI0035CABE5B